MFLKELTVLNFKNCKNQTFSFAENLNCIIGRNGVGKTNILDAIYYCSFCKSSFSISDLLCIEKEERFFTLTSSFSSGVQNDSIHIYFSDEKEKKISCNGKKYTRLTDHIGKFPSIMVTPSDISLIDGGSAERRRFLDIYISQFDADYLQSLVKYNKILDQRNKLLKDTSSGNAHVREIIDVYDMQMCELALVIDIARRRAIEEIAPHFDHFYRSISGDAESVNVEYNTETDYANFQTVLKENYNRDFAIGHTSKGIHRDDLSFILNGQSLKQTGSQGQKKTFLLALTFAKYKYILTRTGIKPILLLDDLFDKLDKGRMSAIIEIVSGEDFGQIFLTDTDRDSVREVIERFKGRNAILEIE